MADVEASEAARVWRLRERIEWQAHSLFASLAVDLEACGEGGEVAVLARQASRDEERHAGHCRNLVRRFGGAALAPVPHETTRLGPPQLLRAQRALFTSVALSCVTETFSTALLFELRRLAIDRAVRETVNTILKDEVDHARIGWAHLGAAARRSSVSWLSPHVPAMLRAAMGAAGGHEEEVDLDLAGYGILRRSNAMSIFRDVAEQVLFPGLERFGIDTREASRTFEPFS